MGQQLFFFRSVFALLFLRECQNMSSFPFFGGKESLLDHMLSLFSRGRTSKWRIPSDKSQLLVAPSIGISNRTSPSGAECDMLGFISVGVAACQPPGSSKSLSRAVALYSAAVWLPKSVPSQERDCGWTNSCTTWKPWLKPYRLLVFTEESSETRVSEAVRFMDFATIHSIVGF